VLAATATELGLGVCETPVWPGRNNIRITLTGGPGPGLLLLGHTDVVPVGEGWNKDPFGGVVEDDRIYGRGASDMKGGLAASLSAMAALRGAGLNGPVELAALVDEEETGIGISAYIESALRPFLGCITAEPTDLQTVVGARGASYLRVEIRGTACHAGKPEVARTRSTARPTWSPRSNACTATSRCGRTRCWAPRPGASGRSTAAPAAP